VLVAALVCASPHPALADPATERLRAQIERLRGDLAEVVADAIRECGGDDALCFARRLAARRTGDFTLVPVGHPTTDQIRFARDDEPVRVDGRVVAIDAFSRKVMAALDTALRTLGPGLIEIDLSRNAGGDLARMEAVAARLAGERGAVATIKPAISRVRVSPDTASAAELLAARLVAAGAALCGPGPTAGETWRKAVLTADHDWRLVVRLERFAVAGLDQSGRLVPDRRCD
jgi:hypothetical protein